MDSITKQVIETNYSDRIVSFDEFQYVYRVTFKRSGSKFVSKKITISPIRKAVKLLDYLKDSIIDYKKCLKSENVKVTQFHKTKISKCNEYRNKVANNARNVDSVIQSAKSELKNIRYHVCTFKSKDQRLHGEIAGLTMFLSCVSYM